MIKIYRGEKILEPMSMNKFSYFNNIRFNSINFPHCNLQAKATDKRRKSESCDENSVDTGVFSSFRFKCSKFFKVDI